jgi:hypothetical protein
MEEQEEINSLISAHNSYIRLSWELHHEVVKSCNTVGYPTDPEFITAMKNFKSRNQEFVLEMQRLTRGFDALGNKAVQLTRKFRNTNLQEIFLMQAILNAEWDKILNEILVPAAEPNAGQLNMRRNAGAIAPGEAAEPNKAGSCAESSTGGNARVAVPREAGWTNTAGLSTGGGSATKWTRVHQQQ